MENFLSLTKMPKQELQGARDEGRVIVHHKIEQDTKKHLAPLTIKVELRCLRTEKKKQKELVIHVLNKTA